MFPFAVNGLLVVMSVVTILYGRFIPLTVRLVGGFLCISILMILLPLAAEYFADPDKTGYALCLVILLIFSIFSGTLQSSVFGLGGMLPFKYMGAIMLGNGLSGISTNILQTICLLALPDNEFESAMVYFVISAGILVSCAVGALVLSKNKYFEFYIKKANKAQNVAVRRISGVFEDGKGLLDKEGNLNDNSDLTGTG